MHRYVAGIGLAMLLVIPDTVCWAAEGLAEPGVLRDAILLAQAPPAQPDKGAAPQAAAQPVGGPAGSTGTADQAVAPHEVQGYSYDPSGRRDPFNPLIQTKGMGKKADKSLPPLQQVGLTELTLIGVIWGGYGYTAMVQTPDGKGYAVRRGTKVGPNNGIVSKITENGIVVTERFTDIYGKEQAREYVKNLHSDEGP